MKSQWRQGGFRGLTKRMENIKNLWSKVIDHQVEEIEKKVDGLKNAIKASKLAKDVSEMDKEELKGKVLSDDLD